MLCAASNNASAALELPPDVVARAWADIARPSEVAKQRLALRALAAAARYRLMHCGLGASIAFGPLAQTPWCDLIHCSLGVHSFNIALFPLGQNAHSLGPPRGLVHCSHSVEPFKPRFAAISQMAQFVRINIWYGTLQSKCPAIQATGCAGHNSPRSTIGSDCVQP